MKKQLFLIVLLIFSSLTVSAKVHVYKGHSDSLANINGWKVPSKSLELYLNYQITQDESLTKDALLYNLMMNRLLSQHALTEIGKEKLNDDSKVAYTSETALRELFTAVIRFNFNSKISEAIKSSSKQSLSTYITHPLTLTKDQLKQVMSPSKKSFLLVYRLNDEQVVLAKETQLLCFQFPNEKKQTINLFEIYEASNIQEKIAIHQLDLDKLKELIQRYMTALYAHYWLTNYSGLSQIEIQALQDFIYQNRIVGQYYRYTGFKAGIHDDNLRLKEISETVTLDEIKSYYSANMESFSTILKVRARHITLDSQVLADQVQAELSQGLAFEKAIEKYSIAEDKHKSIPGDLGWIERSGKKGWLSSLPFTQKKGLHSPAFMSPMNNGKRRSWEIVYVDDKIEGFYPVDSETVRYQAARIIAEHKIHQHIMSLRSALVREANIYIPQSLMPKFENEKDNVVDIDLFHQSHDHAPH